MRHGMSLVAMVMACLLAGAGLSSGAFAQDAAGDINQVVLTEAQVTGLIAAQPDLAAIAKKLDNASEGDEVGVEKELDAIATNHGFKNFADLDDVSATVQLVLDGLDPETGEYVDPVVSLKEELEEVKADSSMDAEEKKELIGELEEALTAIPPLKHKENIEIVKKHRKAILDSLDAGEAGN